MKSEEVENLRTLEACRDVIDDIDERLLALINERMQVVQRVGEIKNESGAPIYRPEREKAILRRLKERNEAEDGLLNASAIEAIFLEIFAVARNLELPERIAYLGPEGTFTHQAAESRFGAMSEYLPMNTISGVFRAVESGRVKFGVVPIESRMDGVVGETLDLLGSSPMKIVAELYMTIHMAFATKAPHMGEIKRIYSKDKGFGQCRSFLGAHGFHNVEQIPVDSTAKAAILASKDPESAAICSHIAAKLYGVPAMFENIEDVTDNTTRFIILSDFKNSISGEDKTSILAHLEKATKPGTLVHFLQDFDAANINLSKIESRPTRINDGFGYWFFIDFYGHIDDPNVQKVVRKHFDEISWLGSYVKGEQ